MVLMMDRKRIIYILVCVVALGLWIAFGIFEANEAPYVRF
jgi:hypothetical protein